MKKRFHVVAMAPDRAPDINMNSNFEYSFKHLYQMIWSFVLTINLKFIIIICIPLSNFLKSYHLHLIN